MKIVWLENCVVDMAVSASDVQEIPRNNNQTEVVKNVIAKGPRSVMTFENGDISMPIPNHWFSCS